MDVSQHVWTETASWSPSLKLDGNHTAQLVFAFGGRHRLEEASLYQEVVDNFPNADIIWCSTAGEIAGTRVYDESLVLTAVSFQETEVRCVRESIDNAEDSAEIGARLAKQLSPSGLVHAMVFSDGLNVNGSQLVAGIMEALPNTVATTGGLVGDGSAFEKTVLGLNEKPTSKEIILVGFYGAKLHVGYGSLGGWDSFGPERLITKSKGNVLYELDGKPALNLYKEYLGDQAKDLPSSGLLFPLSITVPNEENDVEIVRTILSVDESNHSLTFAGDIPEGARSRLMKANFERLIDGAGTAASSSQEPLGDTSPDLALLISCVGRKLVLNERTEEELEAVQDTLGKTTTLTGFYSYGEICPTAPTERQCQLHNQTMTITTFREA